MNTKDKASMIFAALMTAEKMNSLSLKVMLKCYTSDKLQLVHELAEEMKVSAPAITRTLDKLENLNLLKRNRDQGSDRRKVEVSVTTKGSRLVERMTFGY